MPTILRKNGFRFMIYVHDHEPAHVHATKAGTVLVVMLAPMSIRENRGMNRGDINHALSIIADHGDLFISEWNRLHP